MSTEHQQYSTENQSVTIKGYADERRMRIVRTYADDGKSGLHIAGREALKRLILDVESGTADFDAILVYDVSRWGRFQDTDESAYYEYLCKRANIAVHYCAEPFANDGSLSSTLLKTIKRTMAGEYSRELSVKVFAGQCHLIELGFRQGGPPGFGLRRQLVDQNRTPKAILAAGERKSLQTDRVVLVPGPDREVEIVNKIYRWFIDDGKTEATIADQLNRDGIVTDLGRAWTSQCIRQILTNPKYIGTNVYNRRSFKLKRKRVTNPPEMWISRNDAFPAIVLPEMFLRAQEIIENRHRAFSDEQMLDLLRRLLLQKGRLSGFLIDEADAMPSSNVYRHRFQSLFRAYSLIGYSPQRDHAYIEINRRIRARHQVEIDTIRRELEAAGADVTVNPRTEIISVNQDFTASVVLARCRSEGAGHLRWLVRLDTSLLPDITIAARMQPDNNGILDYFLLPAIDELAEQLSMSPENGMLLDVYRFDNLMPFLGLCRRRVIEEAA